MFKPILHKLCPKYFKETWDDGYKQALAEQSYEREKGASIQYHVQLKKLLGKRVVYLPNEWQDPFFGTVVGSGPRNTTEVVVADFLTELNNNKVLISYKSLYHADRLFVEAILKLDPMERWNLLTLVWNPHTSGWGGCQQGDNFFLLQPFLQEGD